MKYVAFHVHVHVCTCTCTHIFHVHTFSMYILYMYIYAWYIYKLKCMGAASFIPVPVVCSDEGEFVIAWALFPLQVAGHS